MPGQGRWGCTLCGHITIERKLCNNSAVGRDPVTRIAYCRVHTSKAILKEKEQANGKAR